MKGSDNMFKFRYMPIKYNQSSRNGKKIEYIVIHDTGNSGVGANALSHQKYFGRADRQSSAHYFVDEDGAIQIIGDSKASWHCGDYNGIPKAGRKVTNSNSLGIELCINSDGNYQIAYNNLVELVKNLMIKFNIPIQNVVRHFDVSGKRCPGTFFANNWQRWQEFKIDIQ